LALTKVTSGTIEDGTIVNADLASDIAVTGGQIADDAVTTDKLANSINTEITANTAKVTNATHTGDVTGATALTIAVDAVDIPMLSATGTADATTFLRGDNTWNAAGGGGFIKYTVYTGDHTWLKSANSPTKVVVEVQGAGGGGGGSHSAYSSSGGSGGAGGYCRKFIDVSSVTQALIVVGTYGTGGAQAVNGTAGGASSWIDTASGGSSTITGSGGGLGFSWSTNTGGAGGAASGGDINIPGTNGTSNALGSWSVAGAFMGMPQVQRNSANNKTGLPGVGYGGQGLGGTGPGVYSGGNGTSGVVIVWEYA
jgi:hypothetical protein